MSGYGVIIYWSFYTTPFSSHHSNNNGISDDEILEVSAVDKISGNISLENSPYSSRICGVCHNSDNVIGGSRSQETSHSSSCTRIFYHSGDYVRGG